MKKFLIAILILLPINVNAYSTSASSAILMDMDSHRIIYAKNSHNIQSIASISKIMTAVIATENINIKTKVTIGDEIKQAYGSGIYIKKGEKLTIEDLLYGLMLRSGNDAALAIAVHTSGSVDNFVQKMNEKAKEIGMEDTTFNNPSGLDEEKGNYSSAYDMALLMSYAMNNREFKRITGEKKYKLKTNKNTYIWHNKNKLLYSYKYTTGGKTGFTKIAKRTLVTSARKSDLNLTAVTLNDGNDWNDHRKLYEEAFKSYSSYKILNKGYISVLGENYYKNNKLYIKHNFKYPLLDSEKDNIKLKFKIEKKRNPNNKEKVGRVEVFLADKKIKTENIYLEIKDTKRKSLINKIKDWIKND